MALYSVMQKAKMTPKKRKKTKRQAAKDRKKRSPKLIGYIRVSTDEQANNGLSLTAQRRRIHAYARALGYKISRIEEDKLSGKLPPARRPGLGRALVAVREGDASGIVVFKLDRLSRSTIHVLKLADEAKSKGWQLLSVNEQLDTSTATGQFVLTLFAALAEMERKQICERTAIGMQEVARQGRARSSKLPFGHRIQGEPDAIRLKAGDTRRLVQHRSEQAILKRIGKLQRQGKGGHAIATLLNNEGINNPRTGKPWNPSTLRGIIRTVERRQTMGE